MFFQLNLFFVQNVVKVILKMSLFWEISLSRSLFAPFHTCLSPSHPSVSHFISLLDTCLGRDCYSHHHKQLLISWKQKLNSIWMMSGPGRRGGSRSRSRMGPLRRCDSGGPCAGLADFPISHWASQEEHGEHGESQQTRDKRKRLSLQNEVTNNTEDKFKLWYFL